MHCGFLCAAHIAPDFTRVVCTDAVTIFETTDVYELGFSNLSILVSLMRPRGIRNGA